MAQLLFIVFTLLLLLAILGLFLRKAGLQLQYLRLQRKEEAGKTADFLRFSWRNEQARAYRWQAFLMFPMLYPVALDDEDERLLEIKRKVKRTHIYIYLCLIGLIIIAIYSEKVFA